MQLQQMDTKYYVVHYMGRSKALLTVVDQVGDREGNLLLTEALLDINIITILCLMMSFNSLL